ncbi:hypothetical protein ABKV46_06295 [Enterobacter hormaechei]
MITLNKEWLLRTIAELEEERDATPGAVNEDVANALAAMKLALASLEAEAVSVRARWKDEGSGHGDWKYYDIAHRDSLMADETRDCELIYSAPPAPVSVPDFGALTKCIVQRLVDYGAADDDAIARAEEFVYNACRAAMLQGAELPEGWVAVPVEPTEDMIVNGFESEPDGSFSDEKEWEAYEAMSGCQQAAHRATLCWAAMLSAAPKI